jgi:hypothetical protein
LFGNHAFQQLAEKFQDPTSVAKTPLTPTLSPQAGLRYSHISARSSVADAFMLLEMVGGGSIDDAS